MNPDFPDNSASTGPPDERYDRQVRIPGWDQSALARARVGVAGDDPWLTGLYVVAAAALGVGRLTVAAPELDPRLRSAAFGLNPELALAFFPGYVSHPLLEDIFAGSAVLVDLGHHALAAKLLLNLAHRDGLPLVRGSEYEEDGRAGFRLFTYRPGREWQEILTVLPRAQLPAIHRGDPGLALIVAGLVLEETKKLLLGEEVTAEVVSYSRPGLKNPRNPSAQPSCRVAAEGSGRPAHNIASPGCPIAIVGAGALGNFVALGLAAQGFGPLTLFDPDRVELTNLNRQVLFWDQVGRPKASALAERIGAWFGTAPAARVAYVTRDADLSAWAAVFDCTDNFASRIVLSEKCRQHGQVLISGGTGAAAGQVVIYDPSQGGPTPAELLGLYELAGGTDVEVALRQRASCLYAPEPAVIMTNQVIGGLMVDAFSRLLAGEAPPNLFYDARGAKML